MPNIILEIECPDDDSFDSAYPFTLATAAFLAKILGVPVSVGDGYGNIEDFPQE